MRRSKGFTLIELLIVVAIIAILAAIAVPNFLEAQTRSKVSRTKADMRTVSTALEAYGVDNNGYPPMYDYGTGGTWGSIAPPFHSRISSHLTTPISFITSIPHDPFSDKEQFLGPPFPEEVSKRYVYYNYEYFFVTYGDSALIHNRANDAGAWLFYSPGPDRDWLNGPYGGVYLNYDPTNGTVSYGNIFRTQKTNDEYVRGDW